MEYITLNYCLYIYNQPTKNSYMKKNVKRIQIALSAMIILAFLAMPSALGQAGKANFAGSWALNAEKSQMGQGGGAGAGAAQGQGQGGGQRMGGGGMGREFVTTQAANLLSVESSRTNQSGEVVKTTTKYTLDGKECLNGAAGRESKSTATWSADCKTLTIKTSRTFDMNGESRTTTSTQEWTLAGPNLQVKSTTATQNGERVTTMVYDKK
jgi:hypothetical protein